jgi:hypothetical protein
MASDDDQKTVPLARVDTTGSAKSDPPVPHSPTGCIASLTAYELHFIASVLTDHAEDRAASEDQPDGASDAAICRRIAIKAAKLAWRVTRADVVS